MIRLAVIWLKQRRAMWRIIIAGRQTISREATLGTAIHRRPEETSEGVIALWTAAPRGTRILISLARGSDFNMVESLEKILGEEAVRGGSYSGHEPGSHVGQAAGD